MRFGSSSYEEGAPDNFDCGKKKEKFRGNDEKRLFNAEGDKCMYVQSTWPERLLSFPPGLHRGKKIDYRFGQRARFVTKA